MRRIDRGIEVDDHLPARAAETKPMPVNEGGDQGLADPVQIARTGRVLQTGDGWLGGQGIAHDGIVSDEHLVYRVMSEPRGVVAVRIPAGQAEDPLREKLGKLVIQLPGHAPVAHAARELFDQSETSVGRLEEHGPAVGSGVGQVKLGDEGTVKELWKENTGVVFRLGTGKSPVVRKVA